MNEAVLSELESVGSSVEPYLTGTRHFYPPNKSLLDIKYMACPHLVRVMDGVRQRNINSSEYSPQIPEGTVGQSFYIGQKRIQDSDRGCRWPLPV